MALIGATIILAFWLPRFISGREPAASALLILAGMGAIALVPGMPRRSIPGRAEDLGVRKRTRGYRGPFWHWAQDRQSHDLSAVAAYRSAAPRRDAAHHSCRCSSRLLARRNDAWGGHLAGRSSRPDGSGPGRRRPGGSTHRGRGASGALCPHHRGRPQRRTCVPVRYLGYCSAEASRPRPCCRLVRPTCFRIAVEQYPVLRLVCLVNSCPIRCAPLANTARAFWHCPGSSRLCATELLEAMVMAPLSRFCASRQRPGIVPHQLHSFSDAIEHRSGVLLLLSLALATPVARAGWRTHRRPLSYSLSARLPAGSA